MSLFEAENPEEEKKTTEKDERCGENKKKNNK